MYTHYTVAYMNVTRYGAKPQDKNKLFTTEEEKGRRRGREKDFRAVEPGDGLLLLIFMFFLFYHTLTI